jgi:MFS family permease
VVDRLGIAQSGGQDALLIKAPNSKQAQMPPHNANLASADRSTSINDLAPPPSSTLVRYGVLAFLCLLALLLYVDRICIGQAASKIQQDLHLSNFQISLVFNAFGLAYCLFEVPTGHWGDRYGSRGVITRIAIWWSIFTALTGAAIGVWSLLLIRFMFGAGEAGAFPNTARVVARWFPPAARGMARGWIVFVSMIGAMIAPVMSEHLIAAVGWRMTFAIFGAAGVVWAVCFYRWFRDNPAEHPAINAAELAVIGTETAGPQSTGDHVRIPWKRVLSAANVWLLGAIMSVNSVLFYTQFQWYPNYLKSLPAASLHGQSSGWLTSLVMSGGALGCIAGGLLADAVVRRTSERKWSQRLCGAVALALASVSMLSVHWVHSVEAVTFCNAAALFSIQLGIPTWWAAVAQISGRHGAAMWGLMNSLGGLVVMGATSLVGTYLDFHLKAGVPAAECWGPVFDGVGIVLAVGAVCWMNVDVTRSIVEPERK